MTERDWDIYDLTIGNYLMLNRSAIIEVDRISGKTMSVNEIPINDEILNAIPLTYEWMRKLGFVDPAANGMGARLPISSEVELCWYTQPGELRLQTIENGWTKLLPTKYVHQLQNLYWELTKTELRLKTE